MRSNEPTILPRERHSISRRLISENALKVLHRLRDAGYEGLLVGGCVRDLMLGREPKDFDVVTDARPEEIRKLFHSARIIGRRFRLVHVRFGREFIEVATFRAAPRDVLEWSEVPDVEEEDDSSSADGGAEEAPGPDSRSTDTDHNIFGTQEEDAVRRDFTVNTLYYDIRDRSVVDYVDGVKDLRDGIIRIIGDPETRFREDPVRMLRAVRFAAKLSFKLADETAAVIPRLAHLLAAVPPARMFEEVLKLFHGGYAAETYELLRHYGLFRYVFPLTDQCLADEREGFPITLVVRALANTDIRINEGKPVTPAFLFAAMLWEPVRRHMQAELARGCPYADALMHAADSVLKQQLKHVSVPRRFSVPMREIWDLQQRLEHRSGNRAFKLVTHPRFRAAYDFLVLCADTGSADPALAQWWTQFQAVDETGRKEMVAALAPVPGKSRGKRRRRGGRGRRHASGQTPVLG